MAKLDAAKRNALPKSSFGLPETRQYPENDKPHARAALSRASHAEKVGHITPAQESRIAAKAHRILGDKPGQHWSKK